MKEAVDGEADARACAGVPTGGAPSVNTGLRAAVQKVWEQIEAAVPEPPDISTVERWYTVATFWPPETRVAGASFAGGGGRRAGSSASVNGGGAPGAPPR